MNSKICSNKECLNAGIEQPLSNFYKDNSHSDGLTSACKTCRQSQSKTPEKRQYNREYYAKNADRICATKRKQAYKWLYGIEYEVIEQMIKEQESKCYICKKYCDKLYLDHRHSDGITRKMLCSSCNFVLGLVHEDVNILQAAIDYLIKYKNGVEINSFEQI